MCVCVWCVVCPDCDSVWCVLIECGCVVSMTKPCVCLCVCVCDGDGLSAGRTLPSYGEIGTHLRGETPSIRWTTMVLLPQLLKGNVIRSVQLMAMKSVSSGKLTFDNRLVVYREVASYPVTVASQRPCNSDLAGGGQQQPPRVSLPSQLAAYNTAKATFWPWISGKGPQNVSSCCVFAQRRQHACHLCRVKTERASLRACLRESATNSQPLLAR